MSTIQQEKRHTQIKYFFLNLIQHIKYEALNHIFQIYF